MSDHGRPRPSPNGHVAARSARQPAQKQKHFHSLGPISVADVPPRSASAGIGLSYGSWRLGRTIRRTLQLLTGMIPILGGRLPLFDQDVQERVGGDFSL
ncbi:hypothetical protein QC762_0110510 [Podospora pseudocomata]|uniref:Uncharacterized protein n=1 Tax=Podospora pseudocomata TaxID=2093779 RepID=A0ABR0G430_9PEZI|nr:hypothetical protein QC762_0110510 [Podospora pseudocomata]